MFFTRFLMIFEFSVDSFICMGTAIRGFRKPNYILVDILFRGFANVFIHVIHPCIKLVIR